MSLNLSRRKMLATTASGAFLSLAPGLKAAFAADGTATTRDTLVIVFLRFGMDGLQMIAPADTGAYRDNRPTIGVRSEGAYEMAAGPLDGVQFFFNPQAPELKKLYDSKKLAVVQAAGVPTLSRSHFLNQDMLERGQADGEATPKTGWIARHLDALSGARGDFAAIANGSSNPVSLLGFPGAMALADASGFWLPPEAAKVYAAFHKGEGVMNETARRSLEAVETVRERIAQQPSQSTAPYTYGPLSARLKSVAQLIKLDLGAEVITVDYLGWDHHESLSNNYFGMAQELSQSLAAFDQDIGALRSRVTLVTMTEFGRRMKENASQGLDHGSASVMLAMGGNVNGGKVYGAWPGVAERDLDDGDLRVTTDYRTVLSEILVRRHGQQKIENVFPTVKYAPLGIVS